jgi:hypothetical protein
MRSPVRPLLVGAVAAVVATGVLAPRSTGATVEEQRARLPPPATCPDKVEGTWLALNYDRPYNEWYDRTLVIRRSAPRMLGDGPGALEGDSLAHFWTGGERDEKPPGCSPGRYEAVVKMPARGSVDKDGKVTFGATSYTFDRVVCGNPGSYNPDNYSGKIDPDRQEFQSVNNDGGRAVNEPLVFRRVRCLDTPGPTSQRGAGKAPPPAFAPPKRAWGCNKTREP